MTKHTKKVIRLLLEGAMLTALLLAVRSQIGFEATAIAALAFLLAKDDCDLAGEAESEEKRKP